MEKVFALIVVFTFFYYLADRVLEHFEKLEEIEAKSKKRRRE